MTLAEAIEAVVGRTTARVDYHALYPARVLQQRADGTLDLVPDSTRVPSCQRVPYRTLRGLSVEVSAGDEAHGHQLWTSDGTPEGTLPVSCPTP